MKDTLEEQETQAVQSEKKYDPRQLNLYRITSLIYQARKRIAEETSSKAS